MATVEDKQHQRDDYLVALYDLSDGDLMRWTTHREIAAASGIPDGEIFAIGQYIVERGSCNFETMGGLDGHVSITSVGVDRAETVIRDRASRGAPHILGLLVLTDAELLPKLEVAVAAIRRELELDTTLDLSTRSNVEADLESATNQLRAAEPNRGVIKAALDRIRSAWPHVVEVAIVSGVIFEVLRGLGV